MSAPEIAGFERTEFSAGKWTRPVYTRGSGPGVIVIHEMPNLHPLVLRFAERIAEAGMTAVCPSLFGEPGRVPTRSYALRQMVGAICIRREFNVWANGRSSPIVDWLRALAREVHAERGGRGVGRGRHVFHRRLRPGDDDRTRRGRAGPVTTLDAAGQERRGPDRRLAGGDRLRPASLRGGGSLDDRAPLPRRRLRAGSAVRGPASARSAIASRRSNSIPPTPCPGPACRRTPCSPSTSTIGRVPRPSSPSSACIGFFRQRLGVDDQP